MLDRAPLEVVPPYLRTLWRGMDSGGLKEERSTVIFPGPSVGLYRVTSEDFYFVFLDKRLFWIYIAYLLENSKPFRMN